MLFMRGRAHGKAFTLCWRCSDVLKCRSSHTPQATEIAMRCISNGKIMQRAKDDEAQKRVEQGGWYIVTKNDYKRWLARQQQQPIGAPDFADIAGRDLHEAVSASPPLPSA
jgi:hypothetical protein